MSAFRDASTSSLRTDDRAPGPVRTTDPVPHQRGRHRAAGGSADLAPSRPPVIHPPKVAPKVTATTCSCGTAWSPGTDRCGFCGLVRPVRLLGIRRLTGRHWLAGPGRRLERASSDARRRAGDAKDLEAEDAWLAAISGALPSDDAATTAAATTAATATATTAATAATAATTS